MPPENTIMPKRCEMTIEIFDFKAQYFPCGKPAKYITPKDKLSGRKIYVCGIHKNSVDAFHKKTGSNKRCKSIF